MEVWSFASKKHISAKENLLATSTQGNVRADGSVARRRNNVFLGSLKYSAGVCMYIHWSECVFKYTRRRVFILQLSPWSGRKAAAAAPRAPADAESASFAHID